MAPLLILVVTTLVVRLAGPRGPAGSRAWPAAVRFGLASMFVATGAAHFVGLRDELIAMVPPALPEPGLLVTVTGVLELLGAAGLLWRPTTRAAAIALGLMLVGMFPANVYAARHGLGTEWTDQLVPRTILQVVFLAAAVVVARHHRPRAARPAEEVPA